MVMEHVELWVVIAAVWLTQLKLMWDIREIKQCVRIEKHMIIREKEVKIKPLKA